MSLFGYSLLKISDTKYKVQEWGKDKYIIEKKKVRWHCSCTGFQFRQTCKHMNLLPEEPKKEEDAVKKIPISRMAQVYILIKPFLNTYATRYEAVGSYRRERPMCKDLDIIMTAKEGDFEIFKKVLCNDHRFDVSINGPVTIRGSFLEVPLDINLVNEEEWGSQLLYRTGPKSLNVVMRSKAKAMGWKLSENGLYDEYGRRMASSESGIFSMLGMIYREPNKRD